MLILSMLSSSSQDLYAGAFKYASVETDKGAIHGKVIGFNANFQQVYESEFDGGAEGFGSLGKERIGTRKEFDDDGRLISSWDTSGGYESVYAKNAGNYRLRMDYLGGFLRSFEVKRRNGDSLKCEFDGDVNVNFGYWYLQYIRDPQMLYSHTDQFYKFEKGGCFEKLPKGNEYLFRFNWDSTIQTYKYPNGAVSSEIRCGDADTCKYGTHNEWKEDGSSVATDEVLPNGLVRHTRYYERGGKMTEMYKRGGKMDSVYNSWFENGRMSETVIYRNGKEYNTIDYDSSGKVLKNVIDPE